eukprot:scaffold228_cov312-Pinguiococcus_pyrenoidosus.AAC.5
MQRFLPPVLPPSAYLSRTHCDGAQSRHLAWDVLGRDDRLLDSHFEDEETGGLGQRKTHGQSLCRIIGRHTYDVCRGATLVPHHDVKVVLRLMELFACDLVIGVGAQIVQHQKLVSLPEAPKHDAPVRKAEHIATQRLQRTGGVRLLQSRASGDFRVPIGVHTPRRRRDLRIRTSGPVGADASGDSTTTTKQWRAFFRASAAGAFPRGSQPVFDYVGGGGARLGDRLEQRVWMPVGGSLLPGRRGVHAAAVLVARGVGIRIAVRLVGREVSGEGMQELLRRAHQLVFPRRISHGFPIEPTIRGAQTPGPRQILIDVIDTEGLGDAVHRDPRPGGGRRGLIPKVLLGGRPLPPRILWRVPHRRLPE